MATYARGQEGQGREEAGGGWGREEGGMSFKTSTHTQNVVGIISNQKGITSARVGSVGVYTFSFVA